MHSETMISTEGDYVENTVNATKILARERRIARFARHTNRQMSDCRCRRRSGAATTALIMR